MATIETAIRMYDCFSSPLAAIERGTNRFNNTLSETEAVAARAETSLTNFVDKGMNMAKRLGAAYLTLNSIGTAMGVSDAISQTTGRLNLMNDGLQTTKQLQQMIFQSAQATGASYFAAADAVAKMGLLAGNAFSGNRETIAFTEQINKHLAIAGTETAAAQGSMLQLQQAMSMGVLRGQELHSVLQGMPTVVQAIEKYLNKDRAALLAMANEGQLSAGIVKAALLSAADETNRKYSELPRTWAQSWEIFKNEAIFAFQPVFDQIQTLANNTGVKDFISSAIPVLRYTGVLIAGVINNARYLATGVANNVSYAFNTIGRNIVGVVSGIAGVLAATIPIIAGVFVAYVAYLLIANAVLLWHNAIILAQIGLNIVRNAWITTTVALESAWAVVTGVVATAQAILGAILMGTLSPLILVAAAIAVVIGVFVAWMSSGVTLRQVLSSIFKGIVNITETAVNACVNIINVLIGAYNKAGDVLGKVLGFSFTPTALVNYKADFSGFRDKYGDAIEKGTFLDTLGKDLKSFLPEELTNTGGYYTGGLGFDPANAETAKNTKGLKDAMGNLDEDLKYMRDIADRQYINDVRYSNVRIDMSGLTTTVNNQGDLDGFTDKMAKSIFEKINAGAEGAHK